jgi:hypothetical protein
MNDVERACLRALQSQGVGEPVWVNRVLATDTCPVTGGQLFLSPDKARPACLALAAKGYVELDGPERWTMSVELTEKGARKKID